MTTIVSLFFFPTVSLFVTLNHMKETRKFVVKNKPVTESTLKISRIKVLLWTFVLILL